MILMKINKSIKKCSSLAERCLRIKLTFYLLPQFIICMIVLKIHCHKTVKISIVLNTNSYNILLPDKNECIRKKLQIGYMSIVLYIVIYVHCTYIVLYVNKRKIDSTY